jgi:RNA polymerase-interacting CarD/CdnL/TRCF family regulator
MVVAMLSMTMTSYAENENANAVKNVEAYDMNINVKRLAKALDLNKDQKAMFQDVLDVFERELKLIGQLHKDDREAQLDRVLEWDLKNMHYVLDADQYRKYVMLLTITLQNRGLK